MTASPLPPVPLPPVAGDGRIEALAVVIPARNEQDLLGSSLLSVLSALQQVPLSSVLIVVAHHCTDATEAIARQHLAGRGFVVRDDSPHVSGARRSGVRAALRHFRFLDPKHLLLLSTDADTRVPPTWARDVVRHIQDGAAAVAGLAALEGWVAPPAAREAYRHLIEAGIDGHARTHTHAYAANLAVRADAYLAVGGWPAVLNGEDHALLSALTEAGWVVHRPTDLTVVTSGRQNARADGGLGDLLARLSAPAGTGGPPDGRPPSDHL